MGKVYIYLIILPISILVFSCDNRYDYKSLRKDSQAGNNLNNYDLSESNNDNSIVLDQNINENQKSADPGLWTGTWLPSSSLDHWVVDQQELLGATDVSQVPGCLNQREQSKMSYCYSQDYLVERINGQEMIWKPLAGNIISIRYLSPSDPIRINNINNVYGRFHLKSTTGRNIVTKTTMSLSQEPGDFSNPNCMGNNYDRGTIMIILPPSGLGPGCPIIPNTIYYINIRLDEDCTRQNCGYKLIEGF